jgi:O-antigen ligase
MIEKNNNDRIKVYLIIPFYWCILLLWQVFRPVANRSLIDVAFKLLFLLSMIGYIVIKSLYNKINLTKLLLLIVYALCQIATLVGNNDAVNRSNFVDPIFSIILFFVFFILISDSLISTRQMVLYSNIMIVIVCILCFYADFFQFDKIMNALHTTSAYSNAVSSILVSNHEFGLYLCFGIASCTFCIMNKPNKKLIYYIMIVLFSLNLILTFSRTSLLSIIVSGVLVILVRKKHLTIFTLAVIAIGLIVSFNPEVNNFVFNIVLRVNTTSSRSDLYIAGINLFMNGGFFEKLFGIGYNNTIEAAKLFIGNNSFHNAYITILLNGGIMMMLFFLLIVMKSMIISIKCIKLNKSAGVYMIMVLIIALFYMGTQTPIIFSSDLLSFMITSFTFIVPKYYYNSIMSQNKTVNDIV